jgi:hypothetical protein
MPPFGTIEAQRIGERGEHFRGRANITPLLQPRVPGRSDPREQSYFLAPQARRSASEAVWQSDVGRCQSLAART